jgi:hypothetical protein
MLKKRSPKCSTENESAERRTQEKKELANASDDFIESLIYHSMWGSEACMKTLNE